MTDIVCIHKSIYKPTFDTDTGEYLDKCPYKPYERNRIWYDCRCKAGTIFKTPQSFRQHIKSKTHREFINNYKNYYKEVDEREETIKQQRIEMEMLSREVQRLKNKLESMVESIKDDIDFHDCE